MVAAVALRSRAVSALAAAATSAPAHGVLTSAPAAMHHIGAPSLPCAPATVIAGITAIGTTTTGIITDGITIAGAAIAIMITTGTMTIAIT